MNTNTTKKPRGRPALSQDIIAAIKKYKLENPKASVRDIAAELGIGKSSVARYLA
jgi:Mn-dependent DtxR family transcriptional regulator